MVDVSRLIAQNLEMEEANVVLQEKDVMRLILRALEDAGLKKTMECLRTEACVSVRSKELENLTQFIHQSRWGECVRLIDSFTMLSHRHKHEILLLVKSHQYMTLIEDHQVHPAVEFLRNEIMALHPTKEQVKCLSTLLLCESRQQLMAQTPLYEGKESTHERLCHEIEALFAPGQVVPRNRLQNLIIRALELQGEELRYNNIPIDTISDWIYRDISSIQPLVPETTTQILENHSDQVWDVRFSNQGTMLASTSKDKTLIVWKWTLETGMTCAHRINGQSSAPTSMSWSPDDRFLLTCGGNRKSVYQWDTQTGQLVHSYEEHTDSVQAVVWIQNTTFLSCGLDKRVLFWDTESKTVRHEWNGLVVRDIVASRDGSWAIAVCHDNCIRRVDLTHPMYEVTELFTCDSSPVSLGLSSDEKFLLVNEAGPSAELKVWEMESNKVISHLRGHKKNRFVLRATFGGICDAFVACGSEDSQLYIWRRDTGQLVTSCSGHAGTINAVSWNPQNPHMLATGSDDHTIRIWTAV